MHSIKNVGLVGTGLMGAPMARNLLKTGFSVTVYSRTKSKAQAVLDAGATWVDSPCEVAARSQALISCVPDSPDVEAVYLADNGICAGIQPETVAIDMSTVSPETARKVDAAVRGKHAAFLDAPVSGGKTGAEAGTLAIMIGGDEDAFERAMPVLKAVGKTIVHCGPCGAGQLTKLCNQIICGLNLLAVSEAMVFAKKVGLDQKIMLKVVSSGAAASWAVENLASRMERRDFAPMFKIDHQQKDLKIALDTARSPGSVRLHDHDPLATPVPLPGTALVHQLLAANQAAGEGLEGTQALLKTLERLAQAG
ncbi:MAG: NAD(P)-dependent oxidoreductase [Myxococcales bacterium]|nr:MAG: NAD(P)-dependent oxidoreductase [Myxococcales bacterium]